MVNRAKAKGTRFESDVVEYLQAHGFPHAERRAQHGALDRGDVAGVVSWVLEIKAAKQIDLAGYMREVAVEQKNDGARWGAAIVKARGKNVAQAYVVMPLEQFAQLIT